MLTRTGTSRTSAAGRAFTLVELLLSIVLLLLLLSALVFNFAGMKRGASLQEGESQVEGLLRFARGYSESSGRLVQLRLTNSSTVGTNLLFLMVSENDPVHYPGYFEPVFEAQPYLGEIAKLINVADMRLIDPNAVISDPLDSLDSLASTNAEPVGSTNEIAAASAPSELGATISFYPDGSSDSAEITIVSQDEEDTRKIAVRLTGEIGAMTYRYVSDSMSSDDTEDPALEGLP